MNCIDCANANCESASVCDMEVNNCEAYVPSSNFVLLKEMYRIEDFAAFFSHISECGVCEACRDGCAKHDGSCKEAWIAWLKKPPVLDTKD